VTPAPHKRVEKSVLSVKAAPQPPAAENADPEHGGSGSQQCVIVQGNPEHRSVDIVVVTLRCDVIGHENVSQ
jgi:hypothetical protein